MVNHHTIKGILIPNLGKFDHVIMSAQNSHALVSAFFVFLHFCVPMHTYARLFYR